MPSGISVDARLADVTTDPEKSSEPGDRSVPKERYALAPCMKIHGSAAIVSTLFTTVGLAKAPLTVGNGGFRRGWPL